MTIHRRKNPHAVKAHKVKVHHTKKLKAHKSRTKKKAPRV